MSQVVIGDILPYTQAVAIAGQTVFGTNWTADAASDVVVYKTPSGNAPNDVTQVLAYPATYSVAFIGSLQQVQVTLVTPASVGDRVTVTRNTPAARTNLYTNTNFVPTMLNNDFGILTLVDQQAQLVDQKVGPRYNYSAIIQNVIDTIIPILPANSIWWKNATNTAIETYILPTGGVAPAIAEYVLLSPNGSLPNAQALSGLGADSLLAWDQGGGQIISTTVAGTANQITVVNGDGSGTIGISISANPILSGTSGMGIPVGTTGQRVTPTGTNISLRYNTSLGQLEFYDGGWHQLNDSSVNINPGLQNEIAYYATAGTSLSGLTTANDGVLATNGAGVPSISSTLPVNVQDNITQLGIIAAGTWEGDVITVTYGGSGRAIADAYAPITGGTSTTAAHQSVVGAGATPGDVLTFTGLSSLPTWQTPGGAGVTPQEVQNQTFVYAVDSGVQDAAIFTLSPTITVYADGQRFSGYMNYNNTGAFTVDYGGGAVSVYLNDGSTPSVDAVSGNGLYDFQYNSNFGGVMLLNPNGLTAGYIVRQNAVKAATVSGVGTGTVVVAMSVPLPGSGYFNYEAICIQADATSISTTYTIDIDGQGNVSLLNQDGTDIQAGQMAMNGFYYLVNNGGGSWYLTNPSAPGGGYLPTTGGTMTGNILFTSSALAGPDDIRSFTGERALSFNYIASAVNYFVLQNADTGNGLRLIADGIDANVGMVLSPKNSVVEILDSTNTIGGRIRFSNASGLFNTTLGVDAAQGTSLDLTLPAVDGDLNYPMVTDSAGNLSFMQVPGFSAWDSGGTTIGASGSTKVNFATVEFNIGGYYDNSTMRFTPLIPGRYEVLAAVGISSANVVTNTQYNCVLYKTGSQFRFGSYSANLTNLANSVLSTFVEMNGTTDYLELFFFNGNAATTLATNANALVTYFSAMWVGPLT